MYFRFSTKKTVQAASFLLDQSPHRRMSYLRLLKLLYIADREHVRSSQRPIVGTRLVAMKNGPLHGEVFNLIKGAHVGRPAWARYIQKEGYEVRLARNPGVSELSPAEVRTLADTYDRFAQTDDWDLVEATHAFPEWEKNYPDKTADTSCTIRFEDLIDAVGLGADKEAILEDAREEARVDQALAAARHR